jgi:hypothetical protein
MELDPQLAAIPKKALIRGLWIAAITIVIVAAYESYWMHKFIPEPDSFRVTRTIEGVMRDTGGARTANRIQIGNETLFCDLSYRGYVSSCGFPAPMQARVGLAGYNSLNGYQEVVMTVSSLPPYPIYSSQNTSQDLYETWWITSLLAVSYRCFIALLFAIAFYIAFYQRKNKHEQPKK